MYVEFYIFIYKFFLISEYTITHSFCNAKMQWKKVSGRYLLLLFLTMKIQKDYFRYSNGKKGEEILINRIWRSSIE